MSPNQLPPAYLNEPPPPPPKPTFILHWSLHLFLVICIGVSVAAAYFNYTGERGNGLFISFLIGTALGVMFFTYLPAWLFFLITGRNLIAGNVVAGGLLFLFTASGAATLLVPTLRQAYAEQLKAEREQTGAVSEATYSDLEDLQMALTQRALDFQRTVEVYVEDVDGNTDVYQSKESIREARRKTRQFAHACRGVTEDFGKAEQEIRLTMENQGMTELEIVRELAAFQVAVRDLDAAVEMGKHGYNFAATNDQILAMLLNNWDRWEYDSSYAEPRFRIRTEQEAYDKLVAQSERFARLMATMAGRMDPNPQPVLPEPRTGETSRSACGGGNACGAPSR